MHEGYDVGWKYRAISPHFPDAANMSHGQKLRAGYSSV
jgi:hypothetical protein